ncbi:MAG: FAD-dependent oxidoreductase [Saprospiraceae bacterium]|nr:FAD-dependent oxidoreductase [Saprospiraceae bacterium]
MKKSLKTPLLGTLRKAFQMALEAEKRQTDAKEIVEEQEALRRSRRRFMQNTGKAAAIGGLLPGSLIQTFQRGIMPKIAIIGGGVAGLSALHTLKKNGLEATIYESSNRMGGRMFTVVGAMGEGTWTEFGAEFIDTNHRDMWRLAQEFNLEMIDYGQESETKLIKEAFFFDGRHHTLAEVVEAFRTFAPRMQADIDKLDDDISFKSKSKFTRKLDRTSLSKYLEQVGASGWIKKLIEVAYESEYGLSPNVQSSLNLLLLISTETPNGQFEIFGESDERYKVRGGNQLITESLAKKYANHIELNRAMTSIRAQGNQYAIHFSSGGAPVVADFVIITIPFTVLRKLDIKLDMPPVKRRCIDKLGYGINAKLMLGMKNHYWRTQGYTGLCYSDLGIPNGWDNAQLQTADHQAAGLSILFGGVRGTNVGHGTPEQQKDKYLDMWEKIFPGAKAAFNGKISRMDWPTHPHTLCSYVCPTVGQYTSMVGAEQIPIGNVFFAGEHCGGDFAGFMNGAAQSGREAAEAILQRAR